jgi:hypothetical protein
MAYTAGTYGPNITKQQVEAAAKAKAGSFTYKQYMALTYEQWARSKIYILDAMQSDLKLKKITEAQFKAIMKRRDQLYDAKVAEAKKQGKPSVVIVSPDKPYTYPPEKAAAGASWQDNLQKTVDQIQTALKGAGNAASNAAGSAVGSLGGGVSKYLAIGGIGLLLILIVGRK